MPSEKSPYLRSQPFNRRSTSPPIMFLITFVAYPTGKASITLTEWESELSLMERPISTISFFDGDFELVAPVLKSRVETIIDKNPWLAGCFAWDESTAADAGARRKMKIFFDESGKERCTKGHFQVFEPYVIPIIRGETKYNDYSKLLGNMGALVPLNFDLIGTDGPFWRVAVIPDADSPHDRFALVVSMSHVAGDAHTYYQLFNMLDQNATALPLDVYRIPEVRSTLASKVGSLEGDYLRCTLKKPTIDWTKTANERKVSKMFFIDEDFVSVRKAGCASSLGVDVTVSGRVVPSTEISANSILTSWFFKTNDASVGLMLVDLRNRIDLVPLGNTCAGNYVFPIPYTAADYATPDLIHNSTKTLRRCGHPATELPAFRWDKTSSISVNWSNHLVDGISFHGGGDGDVTMTQHLPIWDFSSEMFPNRVSCMQIFTACPRRGRGKTTGNELESKKTRAGAFVMCSESAWEKIRNSGIVDEMIADIC